MGRREESRVLNSGCPITGGSAGSDGGRRLIASLLCGATLVVILPESAAAPIDDCIDCHGTDGVAAEDDIPHLNGQPEHLLVDMMDAFREGLRPPKVLIHREVRADNVEPIAAYYARQRAQRPRQDVRPELVAQGEGLHWKYCAGCHMDNGRASDKNAPLTAAQNLEYLIVQARAFKSGARALPELTDRTFRELSETDLIAIAHFYAAQDQQAPKQERRRRR